jgi:hypothetical protein
MGHSERLLWRTLSRLAAIHLVRTAHPMTNPLIHRPRKRFGQDRSPALTPHVTHKVTHLYNSIDAIFGDRYQIPMLTLSF